MDEDNPPFNPNYNPSYRGDNDHIVAEPIIDEYDTNILSQSNNISLSNNSNSRTREVGGAAVIGTAAGLVIAGPIVGVAAGGAAAYAATSNGTIGNAARQSGETISSAGDKAKEINKKHEITKKSMKMAKSAVQSAKRFDEKHQVVDKSKKMASSAVQKTKKFDEKHHVVDKSKKMASSAVQKTKDINEKHHVVDKSKKMASSAVQSIKFISKSVKSNGNKQKAEESGRSNDIGTQTPDDLPTVDPLYPDVEW